MPVPTPPAHHAPQPIPAFRARTQSLEYVQHLAAGPAEVMPFLTPTGERAWAEDWDPTVLHPAAGPEGEGTVFLTAHGRHARTWWVCTEFTPPGEGRPARIAYAHFRPDRDVTTIHILLEAEGPGRTRARIRYAWTGLTPEGNAFVAQRTPADFERGMRAWEDALNAALARR